MSSPLGPSLPKAPPLSLVREESMQSVVKERKPSIDEDEIEEPPSFYNKRSDPLPLPFVDEETLSKEQTVNFPNLMDDGASLG